MKTSTEENDNELETIGNGNIKIQMKTVMEHLSMLEE